MKYISIFLVFFSSLVFGSVFPTSWNLTQTTNGMVISAGQLLGTNDGSISASSGNVGQIFGPISRVRSSALSLTNNTAANIVATTPSITLDNGQHVIYARGCFTTGLLTTVSELSIAVSATSATIPANDTMGVPNSSGEVWKKQGFSSLVLGSTDYCVDIAPYSVNIANGNTQTLYLVARGSFGVSTLTAWGSLSAERSR